MAIDAVFNRARKSALRASFLSQHDAIARNARVDFLRGIAISLVLVLHFSLTYSLVRSPLSDWFPREWVRAVVINGNYGVTIFFVVSGYLITTQTLHRAGELPAMNWRTFYVYRFTRIIPALLLVLVVISVLAQLGLSSFTNSVKGAALPAYTFWLAVLSVLTLWHNVLMQSMGYFNYALNIYWSLSVEEAFYLVFPLVCVLLRGRAFVSVMLMCLIAGPLYRMQHDDNEIFFMYNYWACFDAIAMGCLRALVGRHVRLSALLGRTLRALAFSALACSYVYGIHGHEVFGFTLVALSSAVCLLASSNEERAGVTTGALAMPLRWLGRHSYELYLFHIVVLGVLREYVPRGSVEPAHKLPLLLAYLLASALLAFVVARYFAEPIQRILRARWALLR